MFGRFDEKARSPASSETPGFWTEAMDPHGVETRLGKALSELIRQSAGRTLSGIVILSDGGQNSGVDPATAR